MRNATIMLFAMMVFPLMANAQLVDYSFTPDNTADYNMPYVTGLHSGARGVSGPFDTDNDGLYEIVATDYSAGGRVHVLEATAADTWELVWSAPFADSTATSNARFAVGDADLDGDGNKEIAFYSGAGYSDTNPNVVNGTYKPGLFVFEHTGNDNDFGTLPAFVCDFNQATTFFIAEWLGIKDVDGDGVQEILAPQNNSGSAADYFYVYSVAGTFEPDQAASTFATCNSELTLARNDDEDFNFDNLGGGSPYAMHPADLDGDGTYEMSFHAWNSFNFFNVDAAGADTYALPDTSMADPNLQASAAEGDHVALFAGTVADINQDGDDEVFYPRFQTGDLSVLNYESGEDVLKVTADNFVLGLLPDFSVFGVAAGDVTMDGNADLIGAGASYTGGDHDASLPSSWITVAAWIGDPAADPEDPSNYDVRTFDTSSEADTSHLNFIVRDSLGTVSEYHETATGKFATKVAYLGDADNDGQVEIAVAFQSVADSIQVIDEVWNADSLRYDRVVRSTSPAPMREFVRILSADGFNVAVEDTRFILPDDYKLLDNYPNPFNPSTTIGFDLPIDKRISVKVYDITGRLVRTLVNNEFYPKGVHEVSWDGSAASGAQVASGTYLYTLEYGNFRQSKTMTLIK